jgi:hypothetical protein
MAKNEQVELAKTLVAELQSDFLAEDLDHLTLLDIMGVMGIHLAVSTDSNVASEAYLQELTSVDS